MTVPNAVTGAGVLFTLCYAAAYLTGNTFLAAVCFGLVCLSDLFDGYLARVLDQATRFGAVIYVVRDKLFFAAMVVHVFYAGVLTPYETGWLGAVMLTEVVVWTLAVYIWRSRDVIPSIRWHLVSQVRQAVFIPVFAFTIANVFVSVPVSPSWLLPLALLVSLFSLAWYVVFIVKT